jgi:hypothetical protein
VHWEEVAAREPELAATVREEFERRGLLLVGTLTADSSPRISATEPYFLAEDLWLGMMWRSRKAVDLLRDPRLVLHNPICTNTGDESEAIVRGRAVVVADEPTVEWYRTATKGMWKGRFHLFRIDVESVALVRYSAGEQYVKVWPAGKEFRRPYG